MKTLIVSLLIAGSLFFPKLSDAQRDYNERDGESELFDNTEESLEAPPGQTDAPIDGGLSILLVAGAAYGAKKIADNRKKGKENIT